MDKKMMRFNTEVGGWCSPCKRDWSGTPYGDGAWPVCTGRRPQEALHVHYRPKLATTEYKQKARARLFNLFILHVSLH